jgi:hypothetical protein
VEERDYRSLLDDLPFPTRVLVALDPFGPPGHFTKMPGLVSEVNRDAYRGCARCQLKYVPDAGHDLAGDAPYAILQSLREMLGEAATRHSA